MSTSSLVTVSEAALERQISQKTDAAMAFLDNARPTFARLPTGGICLWTPAPENAVADIVRLVMVMVNGYRV